MKKEMVGSDDRVQQASPPRNSFNNIGDIFVINFEGDRLKMELLTPCYDH